MTLDGNRPHAADDGYLSPAPRWQYGLIIGVTSGAGATLTLLTWRLAVDGTWRSALTAVVAAVAAVVAWAFTAAAIVGLRRRPR
jgi:hypothetical protein